MAEKLRVIAYGEAVVEGLVELVPVPHIQIARLPTQENLPAIAERGKVDDPPLELLDKTAQVLYLTDVAVDDYLMVHDTSVDDAVDGTVQLKRAKVSVVQKVGTTEYVVSAAGATGGPTITSTGATTATIDIDLDGSPFQTMELDGGSTYTFQPLSNQTASTVKTVTVRVTVGGSGAVTFDGTALAAWEWPERASNTEPSGIDNGKVGLLSLTSFGTGNANVIAAFAVTE